MGIILVRLWNDDAGQDLVEYALVAALIALTPAAALKSVANLLMTAFTNFSCEMGARPQRSGNELATGNIAPMTFKDSHLAVNTALLIWSLTLTFTICAGWLDWRTRKIPNWLTVSGFIAGLGVHTIIWGWHGALASLEGAGLALLLLLPLVLLRGLGAGDWKLMGAVGALLGPWGLLAFLFVSALVTGVLAAATVIWTKRVIVTLEEHGHARSGFLHIWMARQSANDAG